MVVGNQIDLFKDTPVFEKSLDIRERYEYAIEKIEEEGIDQNDLVNLVRSKIQERVGSFAEQLIKVIL